MTIAIETAVGIEIRNLVSADLPAVAEVHLAAFSESGLTMLGREAVRRYYDWLLTGPHDALALGAFEGGKLAGFCFGGKFRGATSGFLGRNRAFLAWRVATHPWLIASPLLRDRIAFGTRVLKRKRASQNGSAPVQKSLVEDSFGILAIAVRPSSQGQGVADLLMNVNEATALERGFRSMDLTVHPENERAVRFYERHSWRRIPVEGKWSGLMMKEITR